MELSDEKYNKVLKLSEEGDSLVDVGNFGDAIEKYYLALNLIPNPKYIWEASTWLYAALGDAYYLTAQYQNSLNCFFEALKCPDGLGNPFIALRIGECFFETGNNKKATEYLLQAYAYAGKDIFEGENIKYYNLIKNLL